MAKFLPFVVESSTPLYIYKSLISRSKGINETLIASIFNLVVEEGISKVRNTADELPEMPSDKLYEALITSYPQSRVSDKFFKRIQGIRKYVNTVVPDQISKELSNYEWSDRMTFLLVMALNNTLEDYTDLPIANLFDDKYAGVELNIQKYRLFSNEGTPFVFNSKDELASYLHFYTIILPNSDVKPIRAVFSEVGEATIPPKRKNKKRQKVEEEGYRDWDKAKETYNPGDEPYNPEKYGSAVPPYPPEDKVPEEYDTKRATEYPVPEDGGKGR